MPYDHNDPDQFRRILRKFDLSSTYILKIAQKYGFPDDGTLSRQDLDRFIKGDRTEKHRGLALLWRTLERHEIYSKAFPSNDELSDAAAGLAMALPRFFAETSNAKVLYLPNFVRRKFAGRYVMYRAETDEGHKTGLVMRSLMEVRDSVMAPCVFETQRSPRGTVREHNQDDVGFLFTFGERTFFLMKQANGGTCVKFFIITKFDPVDDTALVDTFRGLFCIVSHHGEFGLRKFFCKRLAEDEEMDYRSIELNKIAFRSCTRYIEDDITNETATRKQRALR